jgi:hypothetical protein
VLPQFWDREFYLRVHMGDRGIRSIHMAALEDGKDTAVSFDSGGNTFLFRLRQVLHRKRPARPNFCPFLGPLSLRVLQL